jgi:hypothetical protein
LIGTALSYLMKGLFMPLFDVNYCSFSFHPISSILIDYRCTTIVYNK